jgi:nitrite reductase (NADH) small subunit
MLGSKAFEWPTIVCFYEMDCITSIKRKHMQTDTITEQKWFLACLATDVPTNGGVCVKYRHEQIALFHLARTGEWFATQNQCPHRQQMALSRGMIGSHQGEPKVACPFHKKTFSLVTGECLNGDECSIRTYPVKVEDDKVYILVSHGH